MERKKASDFPQELLNLFDGYVHGGIRPWLASTRRHRKVAGWLALPPVAARFCPILRPRQEPAHRDLRFYRTRDRYCIGRGVLVARSRPS